MAHYNTTVEDHDINYTTLVDQKEQTELNNEDIIRTLEDSHLHNVKQVEIQHQNILMKQVNKYRTLETNLARLETAQQEHVLTLQETHSLAVNDLTKLNQTAHQNKLNTKSHLQENLNRIIQEQNETRNQMEQDQDIEVAELRNRYSSILAEESDNALRLKGENGVMKKVPSLYLCRRNLKPSKKILTIKEKSLDDWLTKKRSLKPMYACLTACSD